MADIRSSVGGGIEAGRARELGRSRSAALGRPLGIPAGTSSGRSTVEDEGAARAEFERGQLAARQASVGAALGVMTLAAGAAAGQEAEFAARPKMSNDERQLWQGIYKALDGAINSFFLTSVWTIILAIFVSPIIVGYYSIRLFRANLLNDGKPVKFPIFGIVSAWLMPLEFPMGIINAMLWIFIALLSALLAVVLLLLAISAVSTLCGALPDICGKALAAGA